MRRLCIALTLVALTSCAADSEAPDREPEATSLLGEPLVAPDLPSEIQTAREAELAVAEAAYDENPSDADAIIWKGRRTAYLGRYREAITIFTEGIAKHPDDVRMYRHRGHRYITTRQFDRAIADFERAAELVAGTPDQVEPDGQPNAAGIPTSTLQSNIWYHLGLAYYVTGDYENALRAYQECQAVSKNDDMRMATTYWHFMTLRRLTRNEEASRLLDTIEPELDLLENQTYHELLRLYQGGLAVDEVMDTGGEADVALSNATIGYGVGFWHEINGRPDEARAVWRRTIEGSSWAAFGYIAAEAEIAKG